MLLLGFLLFLLALKFLIRVLHFFFFFKFFPTYKALLGPTHLFIFWNVTYIVFYLVNISKKSHLPCNKRKNLAVRFFHQFRNFQPTMFFLRNWICLLYSYLLNFNRYVTTFNFVNFVCETVWWVDQNLFSGWMGNLSELRRCLRNAVYWEDAGSKIQ